MKIDLNSLRADRLKCLNWKNIKPKWEMIKNLPRLDDIEVTLGDTIYIKSNSISKEQKSYIDSVALSLLPWEKAHLIYFNTIY